MKILKVLPVILFFAAMLGSQGASGQRAGGQYTPAESGKIVRTIPQPVASSATYDVGPFFTYTPTLAPGEGSREVKIYCNICHSPMYITMQPPLPAATWAAEVSKMVKTMGAPIPDVAAQKIVRYLQSNYTPETRKR